jgi:hypothetical protein
MTRKGTSILLTLPFVLCATSAWAVSPSEEECLASDPDAQFVRIQGEVFCITEENVGRSENSATTTDTTSGKGNIENKQQTECTGPGGSTSSAHCN